MDIVLWWLFGTLVTGTIYGLLMTKSEKLKNAQAFAVIMTIFWPLGLLLVFTITVIVTVLFIAEHNAK